MRGHRHLGEKMRKLSGRSIFAWLLALFFVVGSSTNLFATEGILAEYRLWGYPDWFHYLTGTMELTSAILLAIARTRLFGVLLGGVVMVGAAATLLLHDEYAHALAPIVVLALLGLCGWRTIRAAEPKAAAA